jgi:solute carrier family 25 2-oxodicarboxylate transporter 21
MNNSYHNYIAGSLSGIIEVCVSHPIDRIKTEMQTLTLKHKKSNIKNAIYVINKKNGINGFYDGIFPRIMGIIPMRLTYWGSLKTMNDFVTNQSKITRYFVPGIVAGLTQTIIDNPIEVIKIKLMTGSKQINYSLLYTGFTPCLIRNILFAIPVGFCTNFIKNEKDYRSKYSFFAGALGGFFGSLVSHPFDIIKTEMQRHGGSNMTPINIFKDIYKDNPLKLWSGVSMRCTLGCINMGVGFFAFDFIYNMCKSTLY